jgi:Xaa-Pro aminopeptidase
MDAARTGILLIRARATEAQEQETGFRQNSTFYYLTGVYNALGALLALDADKRETWLFVPEAGSLPGPAGLMQPPHAYIQPGAQTAAELKIDHVVHMILVTAHGAEILTIELPYSPDEIERAMAAAKRR